MKLRICSECAHKLWPSLKVKQVQRQTMEITVENDDVSTKQDNSNIHNHTHNTKHHSHTKHHRKHHHKDKSAPEEDLSSFDEQLAVSSAPQNSTDKSVNVVEKENILEEKDEKQHIHSTEKIEDPTLPTADEASIWSAPLQKQKTREDDFASYFEDMLL